jgi:histidinol phosphatase-like PHP family hydrolase
MRILVGCEADTIAPGRFSITKDFAETLDFTLLSCSHLHLKDIVEQPPNDTPKVIAAHLVKFFLSGVKSGLATIMAHPFVPYGFINMFDGIIAALSDSELFDAFCLAEESGVGIEITAAFLPHVMLRRVSRDNRSLVEPLFSIETPIRLLSIAKQAGCKFTFGSDAHDPAGQRELPGIIELIKCVDIKRDDLIPMLLER